MGKKKPGSAKRQLTATQERELPLESLKTETDFLKYMKLLKLFAQKYCVMIVANDTPVGPSTTQEMTNTLKEIGLQTDLYRKYRCAYAAMIDAGRVVFEELRSGTVEAKIRIGHSEVELVSKGFNTGDRKGLIRIDGREHSPDLRGLNIVVYDRVTRTVLDTARFDTYREIPSRLLADSDSRILKEFVEAHPGVSVIFVKLPVFPADPITPGEQFILEKKFTFEVILRNLHQHSFTLNQYFDEAGIMEVLDIPKSYFDLNGVRRFEDRHGKHINISGGHRETAFQPDRSRRTIFLFGNCTIFGIGSDDSGTIASHLQMQCNKNVPEAGIIIQNYGYCLGGTDVKNDENSKILGSLPVRPGDIVVYAAPAYSNTGDFHCIDLTRAAEQPRNYDVFIDTGHYTPDGNRLIAEGLYKGLMDLGLLNFSSALFLERTAAAPGNLPRSVLRSTDDFAGYLKLLKKYAQRYCVLVSCWDTHGGPGFTEEISRLYREVGFQADLIGNPDCAYAAVIDAGELVYEELCGDAAQSIDVTLTDEDFKFEANIVSTGHNSGETKKNPIEINGNTYSSKYMGFHFVVYDKAEQVAIDAVNFDISLNSVPCCHHLGRVPDEVLPSGSTSKSIANKMDAGALSANRLAAEGRDLPFEVSTYKELAEYKTALSDWYEKTFSMTIGSVVMNCNPFTLGHRFLVEQALTQCDFLIIFVVQENKSRFPFEDRLRLVKEGLADLKNIAVFPSGKFVLSSLTFSEYFNKAELQDRTIDTSLDVTVFAREIAPCLHITKRFAGEEPFDTVTRQYNETMRRVFPEYGVEFIEVPRQTDALGEGTAISASRVRDLLEKGDFDAIKPLVPESTFRYLKGL